MSAAVSPMSPQRLHAAVHWRVEPPFAMDAPDLAAQIGLAGRLAGRQLDDTLRATGFEAQSLLVSSTVMTAAVTMQCEGEAVFYDAIEQGCGLRPEGILNAYMCTGWGYALRHCMRHTDVQRLAIAIVDLDPHNLAWQQRHPVIGPSGFGVTTLLFTLPAERSGVPRCSGPHPNSAFNDFVMALKLHQARHGVQPTFIPFTLEALATTAERVLAKGALGANRSADLGHCFGADPWIGIIDWFTGRGLPEAGREAQVIAGAMAYNGYYTYAPITVDATTRLEFRRLAGDTAALERVAPLSPTHRPSRDAMHARGRSLEELAIHA